MNRQIGRKNKNAQPSRDARYSYRKRKSKRNYRS
jgi:hypothetical protein